MSGTTLICFGNERLTLQEDGWAMLAPFGDFPGVAVSPAADGTVTRSRAIQRVTAEYATELANELASVRGKVRRWLRGVPIYSGHPDMPGGSERWPDKRTLGTTHELQVRADGLYCRPVFTNDGADLIEQTSGLGMSARWTGEPVAEVDGVPVYRPAVLRSIGLTANPNLPVELLNEADPDAQPQPPDDTMEKSSLLALLKPLGIELANDASDAQIETAIRTAGDRLAALPTLANERNTAQTERDAALARVTAAERQVASLTSERDAARTEFANERKLAAGLKLDAAVAAGRITTAQRSEWEPKLVADFANEAPKLDALKPVVKTATIIGINAGSRRTEIANESPAGRFRDLVKAERKTGMSKAEAIQRAIGKNPDLYVEFLNSGAMDLGLD